jgi:aryl-alcohol dehydrogenase-like predicted oxidoreductase
MNKRTLGISNIKVSEIGLGCMGMTHAYGKQRNKIDMITLIQKAIQLGCNFFDTAVVY